MYRMFLTLFIHCVIIKIDKGSNQNTHYRPDGRRRNIKMYVIQMKPLHWQEKWVVLYGRYPTINEAKAAYEELNPPHRPDYRIMEEYTVTRYKAVKGN